MDHHKAVSVAKTHDEITRNKSDTRFYIILYRSREILGYTLWWES